jgi:Sporulation and spore germination/Immunoglobulin-like domain of bacterial spore germination
MTRDHTIEEALRRALAEEADGVQVAPDALGTIRGRIQRRRAHRWLPRLGGMGVAVAGAAAVVVLLAAGVAAVALRLPAHPSGTTVGRGVSGVAGTANPNLPVYYLGPAQRLYREYHVVAGAGQTPESAVAGAVQAMLSRPADDPDYRSPWPAGATVRQVSISAGIVTVDLAGAAAGPSGGAAADPVTARMAAQQLVWTATAQVKGSTGVRLLLDGAPATSLWGTPLDTDVLSRGPAADLLAPIWVIDPQQGTVQGHRFTVNVAGIVFEATMRVRVRDRVSGAVVDDEVVHLSGGAPAQGTGSVTLDLPSGGYTIEGYVVSERDGSQQVYDDHQFTVG